MAYGKSFKEEVIKIINAKLKEFKCKEFLTSELIEGVGEFEKRYFRG